MVALPTWGSSLSEALHLWIQPTADHRSCTAIVFTVEKITCISGLMQLKPMLFKG